MAIKSDRWIRQMSLETQMITPFVDRQVRTGCISYGLSSYGYDVRVADEFKVFTNVHNAIVDPKNFDPKTFVDIKTDVLVLPPNSFALARSVEYIKMPRRVTGLCTCKSTYVRSGIAVPSTVLEAGWEGEIVIEIANHTNLPARVYANEGIMQILFFEGDEDCEVAYGERDSGAKYQGQRGITLSRI